MLLYIKSLSANANKERHAAGLDITGYSEGVREKGCGGAAGYRDSFSHKMYSW